MRKKEEKKGIGRGTLEFSGCSGGGVRKERKKNMKRIFPK